MKKRISLFLSFALLFSLCVSVFAADTEAAPYINVPGRLYTIEEVASSLRSPLQRSNRSQEILQDVLLPSSMGIKLPNIDMRKIQNDTVLSCLNSEFVESVVEHSALSQDEAESLTLSEFWELENNWIMPSDMIVSAKNAYPELKDVDMSQWTYGMYKAYYTQKDQERILARFSNEQLASLRGRGIEDCDLMCLFKEFHTVDTIMSQTNATLKNTIERSYQFTYDYIMTRAGMDITVNRAIPPTDKYQYVSFPRYGSDYFHNDVVTTEDWMQIQSDRALKTSQVLYGTSSIDLACTNMYGTYSYSQGGAHEGIDFTHPAGTNYPTIYAVFNGEKLYDGGSNGQLSVYDKDSPDYKKTYTYLHMNIISAPTLISAGDEVGTQGQTGNATGCHVHFEVHRGETTSLSSGADHVIDSLSPYRLQDYIGELDE